ncbi:hypothetical protein [Mesorhizobium huakuii]|uniref:Uncharacterized protein n=1 Tax=Mesorhizobium huakuii TaxID=28104 RepID=A0A7G6T0S7_9HYPH|nr:hypothetical protein [Mesorhizobium huakuii]QND60359.1 hypothetical protein HB778_30295 [Mesorhizobium huakuii]
MGADLLSELVTALKSLRRVAVWDEDTDRGEFDAALAQADAAIAKLERAQAFQNE